MTHQGFNSANSTHVAGALIRLPKVILTVIALAVSIPAMVLFRRQLGDRFLNVPVVLIGFVVTLNGITLDPVGAIALAAIYSGAVLLHMISNAVRRSRGERWHSRSSGIPLRLFLRISHSPTMILVVLEPLFVLMIGVFLWITLTPVGATFVLMSLGLFVRALSDNAESRAEFQKLIDSQIESEEKATTFRQEPRPTRNSNAVVTAAAHTASDGDLSVRGAYARIDPALLAQFDAFEECQDTQSPVAAS